MQNYNYIVLSPQKQHKKPPVKDEGLIDPENLKFQILGSAVGKQDPGKVATATEKPKPGAQGAKKGGAGKD